MTKQTLPIGLVLILVGGIASALLSADTVWPTWTIIAGVVSLALYAVTNWQSVARRSTFFGLNALLMSVAMVAILAVVYLIAQSRDKSWDFTATGKYTLDNQTEQILDSLNENDQNIKVLMFAVGDIRQGADFVRAKDLLEQYSRHTSRISYEILDPNKDYETAVLYQKDLNSMMEPTLIAQLEVDIASATGEVETRKFTEKVSGLTQEDLSNAIKKVTYREAVTAYFLVGHYERELDSQSPTGLALLQSFLAKDNIEPKPLRLGATGEIPTDADIIALVGPKEDLTQTELVALEEFVKSGGGLFVALDPGELPATTLKLRELGFEVGDDLIIQMEVGARNMEDLLRGVMTARPSNRARIAEFDKNHEITKDLGSASVQLAGARTIGKLPVPPEGFTISDLASTKGGMVQGTSLPNSWSDKNPEEFETPNMPVDQLFSPDNKDTPGPISLIKSVEIDLDAIHDGRPDPANARAKGKIVVVGDSDFITNGGMQVEGGVSRGHLDLSLNIFNWLAGQVDLITIRTSEVDNTSVTLNEQQQTTLRNLFVWVIPTLIGLFGAAITFYRRWKYV